MPLRCALKLLLGLAVCLMVPLVPGATPQAQARQAPAADPTTPLPPVVAQVRFDGDIFFDEETLSLRVRTRPNRRFLGIRGLTWWRWLYRTGASGVLGRRLGRALMTSGEPPAYLDQSVLAADVERLRLLYLQEGFRAATIAAEVVPLADSSHVAVHFRIEPGRPTYVRRVNYDGLDMLSREQQWALVQGSLLPPQAVDRQAPLQYRADDQRYSEPTLLEERRRLLTFLLNQGYAAITRDSIRAIITPERPDSFDVTFRIRAGRRYRFGDVAFVVDGPQQELTQRTDTLYRIPATNQYPGGVVTVQIRQEGRLSPEMLRQMLRFRPGQWYDHNLLLATRRRLEATGVFALTDILALEADTATTPPFLPLRAALRTRPRHRLRFETFMLQRSGALADSDNELGAGVGSTYENVNLFGQGETFSVRATGSVAADIETGFFTSAQWEVSTALAYPYLVRPFRGLDRTLGLYNARTLWSLSLLAARRDALKLVLRGRGASRFRLEMQHTPTVTSLVDLLDITLSNPDTLAGFQEAFLDDVLASVVDPVQRAQIVEDYTQPQINNALRYTLRASRLNPLRRDDGYRYEGAFEVGGNLPYLFDRYLISPGTLEGSLPGLPIFRGGRTDNRLLYRQYVRLIGDLRRYSRLDQRSVLAWKFIAALAHPTGQADLVPFDRRFYSGGASSVRGWRLRELGPGAASFASSVDETSSETTNILGGDVKMEASVEMRSVMLRNVLAAEWILAAFVDAGNVWFGPRNPGDPAGRFRFGSFYNEIGVGSGLGLRVAWEYFIIRLDLAYKVHDPVRSGQFLPERLENSLVHFGIGHAF